MLNIIFKQINFFLHTAAFTNLATSRVIYGDFGKIRTFDLRIRSALLYPAELRSHCGTDWIRTSDTRIFSAVLYQLSYGTILTEDIFIWNLALTTNISYSFYTIVINIYELHTPLESRASSGLAAYRLRAYP